MNDLERFQVENTLEIIETKLRTEPNSCEFEFYLEFKEFLIKKLEE